MPSRPGVDFGMDTSEASIVTGYIEGIATTIRTNKYIEGAVTYAAETLGAIFEQEMDAAAFANKNMFFHVYNWGDDWENRYSLTGVPAFRLWRLMITGKGKDRQVGFTFKPETRPTPIHPELLEENEKGRSVNEGVHVFTWKAPVMEYGMEVIIRPKLPGVKKVVFFDNGQIFFREGPITATPGRKVAGAFSGFFVSWWSSAAPTTFDSLVRPVLERDIVTDKDLKRVARQATRRRTKQLGINVFDEKKGEQLARRHMDENARDYVRAARRRRQALYGY